MGGVLSTECIIPGKTLRRRIGGFMEETVEWQDWLTNEATKDGRIYCRRYSECGRFIVSRYYDSDGNPSKYSLHNIENRENIIPLGEYEGLTNIDLALSYMLKDK